MQSSSTNDRAERTFIVHDQSPFIALIVITQFNQFSATVGYACIHLLSDIYLHYMHSADNVGLLWNFLEMDTIMVIVMVFNPLHTHAHIHTNPHAHVRTHARAHTQARTHTHTHTRACVRTHIIACVCHCSIIVITL